MMVRQFALLGSSNIRLKSMVDGVGTARQGPSGMLRSLTAAEQNVAVSIEHVEMSAEARNRISDAQKARWAKQRGEQGASAEAQATAAGATAFAVQDKRRGRGVAKAAAKRGRRKMSAAARRRISNAQKKRWAAKP